MTPLYPLTEDMLNNVFRDIHDRITKWTMFCANWHLQTTDYYGKPISYSGITFFGSPRMVFWGRHFEPFAEHGVMDCIAKIEEVCRNKNLDPAEYLHEFQLAMKPRIQGMYLAMLQTDATLSRASNIKNFAPEDIQSKIVTMEKYLDDHVKAALFKKEEKEKISMGEVITLDDWKIGPFKLNANPILRWLFKKIPKRFL